MSSPAQTAGYRTWPWEVVLATVLDLQVPDRAEVTGQPWLTIEHGGQGGASWHLIWTASWKPGHGTGAGSLQVYLDPALYRAGGPWDRFATMPGQALAKSGAGPALPLVPSSFQVAGAALASVTSAIAKLTRQLEVAHHGMSAETTPFDGSAADRTAALFGALRGVAVDFHRQLTTPGHYGEMIEAAGTAAAGFLSDLRSAYGIWAQLPWHSPLGAIVRVLDEIAVQDEDGSFVIDNPRDSPFGDLTTDAGWALVEQQAKALWTGTVSGESGDFGGLDLLGRSAVGKLADQYADTITTITPVVGPGTRITQRSPTVRAVASHGTNGRLPGGQPTGVVLAMNSPARPVPAVSGPGGPGPIGGQTGVIGGPADRMGLPLALNPADSESRGFTGIIGDQNAIDRRNVNGRAAGDTRAKRQKSEKVSRTPRAPAAGYSLGGSADGPVLAQEAVPVLAVKPPGAVSSSLNLRLIPGDGGISVSGPAGPALSSPPVDGRVGAAFPDGGPNALADAGGVIGQQPGVTGPVMMPGGAMTSAAGLTAQPRERRAYLPQDHDYWGTESEPPDEPGGSVDHRHAELDFRGLSVFAAIGAADQAVGTEF